MVRTGFKPMLMIQRSLKSNQKNTMQPEEWWLMPIKNNRVIGAAYLTYLRTKMTGNGEILDFNSMEFKPLSFFLCLSLLK